MTALLYLFSALTLHAAEPRTAAGKFRLADDGTLYFGRYCDSAKNLRADSYQCLVSYDDLGRLNTRFGGTGVLSLRGLLRPFVPEADLAQVHLEDMKVSGDGHLVVLGMFGGTHSRRLVVLDLDPQGRLSASFNETGVLIFPPIGRTGDLDVQLAVGKNSTTLVLAELETLHSSTQVKRAVRARRIVQGQLVNEEAGTGPPRKVLWKSYEEEPFFVQNFYLNAQGEALLSAVAFPWTDQPSRDALEARLLLYRITSEGKFEALTPEPVARIVDRKHRNSVNAALETDGRSVYVALPDPGGTRLQHHRLPTLAATRHFAPIVPGTTSTKVHLEVGSKFLRFVSPSAANPNDLVVGRIEKATGAVIARTIVAVGIEQAACGVQLEQESKWLRKITEED